MTKALFSFPVVLLAALLLLTGCDEAAENQATQETATPAPETAEPLAPETDDSAAAPAETASTANVDLDVEAMMAPRVIGDADAPIKLIEYASFTCPHCAHFHEMTLPGLKEKYIDTGKVNIEFREFPLDSAALQASLLARCVPEDQYFGYIDYLFEEQESWAQEIDYLSTLKQNARLSGADPARIEACLNSAALKNAIGTQIQTANTEYRIASTPSFIVNGGEETIEGAEPLEEFERVFRLVSDGEIGALPAPQAGTEAGQDGE